MIERDRESACVLVRVCVRVDECVCVRRGGGNEAKVRHRINWFWDFPPISLFVARSKKVLVAPGGGKNLFTDVEIRLKFFG